MTIVALVLVLLGALYFGVGGRVLASYSQMSLEQTQKELADALTLIPPASLTPDALAHAAANHTIRFDRQPATQHMFAPPDTAEFCQFGSLTFFFDQHGKPLQVHGHLQARNPLYTWQ